MTTPTMLVSPRTADVVPAGIPDNPALACGFDRGEGVLVAYIPKPVEGGPMYYLEHPYRSGKRAFVVYSYDGIVLDMIPADNKGVKWWMVREAARSLGLDYPEPIHTCAAEDFRVSCLPDVPAKPDSALAFRAYGKGPWIKLSDFEVNDGKRDDGTGPESSAEPTE